MSVSQTSRSLDKYAASVSLKDGSSVHIRPIKPEDEDKMLALFSRLSQHTVYLRFHHVLKQMSREEVRRFCGIDYESSLALVATFRQANEDKIIAVARYYRFPEKDSAEVAVVVEDAFQGKGIGTQLLERLAGIAREKGIGTFIGEVLAENNDMIRMLQDSGFHMESELSAGVYRMVLDLEPTSAFEKRSDERERIAMVASLDPFLNPRSIAIIGASQNEASIGNMVFRNLVVQGYRGTAYPVNPKAEAVTAVKAYPTVLDIPGRVDMAVVIVPAPAVEEVLEQCGQKGVRALTVISAGFGEVGEDGMQRQERILEIAHGYGMRMIGPNCMGLLNTAPEVRMNATFAPVFPPAGSVAFCSQSGAVGLAILEYSRSLNVGLSQFVSIGNRADISSNDLLEYWRDDPSTKVILLYIESFGNPRKFARIARTVSLTKPIAAVKSGRTAAGSRAAASHTGALISSDVAVAALFKQAGIIRVDTIDELFGVANLLVNQPLPAGRRVAILTNGGGPGIMTADACSGRGLEIPPLSERTTAALRKILSNRASVANPIDTTADAGADVYRKALELLAEDDNIDSVIAIFIPPLIASSSTALAVREAAPRLREKGKTLLACFMSASGTPPELESEHGRTVPLFSFPEDTADALGRACDYSEWIKRSQGTVPQFDDIDVDKGRSVIEAALKENCDHPFWLNPESIRELLASYGIRTVRASAARTADEAADLAEQMGFPVVVKLDSDTITHKTEVGGVVLGLESREAVRKAVTEIRERLSRFGKEDDMKGVVIQEMISLGVELIVGVTQDPSFGPLMLFGAGGTMTELIKDVTLRIHPLTDVDAREMIHTVRSYELLKGFRGAEPADIPAVEELLLRVSAMIEDLPEIKELDLNPVKALPRGYMVVDARILIGENPDQSGIGQTD